MARKYNLQLQVFLVFAICVICMPYNVLSCDCGHDPVTDTCTSCDKPSELTKSVEQNIAANQPVSEMNPAVPFDFEWYGQEIDVDPGTFSYSPSEGMTGDRIGLPESNAEFDRVEDLLVYEPSSELVFTAKHSDRMEYMGITVINADDIRGYRNYLELGSGEVVQTESAILYNATNVRADNRRVAFRKVDAIYLEADKSILLGLSNSSFTLNAEGAVLEAEITSRLRNNTIELKGLMVTLDEGETYQLLSNGTGVLARSADNVTFQFYDEKIIGAAELWTEGVNIRCVRLAQFSRYELDSDINFGVAAPKPFYFCIQRTESQRFDLNISSCVQCGLVDLFNKELQFKGYFSYLKKDGSFGSIIDSFDNNSISFKTDSMLMNMSDYTIVNPSPEGRTLTHSGQFTILEERSSRMARVNTPRLFLIREYAPTPITISEDALVQKGRNTVIIYGMGAESGALA